MTHISGFGLQNFRVFKEFSEIDFAPITIFTGPNNSGKSSVIKALNLIVDNLAGDKLFENLNFSHESKLGTYNSILANPKQGELVFVFKIDWPAKFLESSDWRLKLIFKTNLSSKNENGRLKEIVFFEKKTKTILIKLDFVNQIIRVPQLMYTVDEKAFILTANISLLLNKLSELSNKSNDPKGKLNLVEFYEYVESRSKNGGFSFPSYTLNEIRTPRRLDKEMLLPFSELINMDKYKGELNLYGPSLKMGEDRYVAHNKEDSLMFHYYFVSDDGLEKYHTSLAEIEKQACENVSNGICAFENDEDYLNFIKKYDFFYLFNINNEEELVIRRSFASTYNINSVSDSIYLYELIFYEVMYLLFTRNIANEVFLDLNKYRELEIEMADGVSNMSSYRSDENRSMMVHENILSIEVFLKKLLKNLLFEFSKSSNFFFVPQSRRNEDRLISKYNSDSYSTNVIKDLLAIEKLREPEEMFFKYWLKEFNIADDVEVENYEGVSFGIYLVKDKRKINLVDLGVGTNQILPIILSIVVNSHNSFIPDPPPLSHYDAITLIMEEPESNLHPNLQSKLADMFIDASYKFNIQFIIETHSEYLIRKIQYWTAKNVIKSKDTALYYFNDPKKKQKNTSQLERIIVRDDGSLSQEFGPGFFDEAINLKLDLLKLKNASKN